MLNWTYLDKKQEKYFFDRTKYKKFSVLKSLITEIQCVTYYILA